MTRHLFALTLALHLAATASWAGFRPWGSLCGEVRDASGAAVTGAHVQLTQLTMGVRLDVTTDAKGQWLARPIELGDWMVVISAPGFKTFKYKSRVHRSTHRFAPKSRPIESRIVVVPSAKEK